MTKLSLTCGLVLTLAACASNPSTPAPAAAVSAPTGAPAATTAPAAGTPTAAVSTKPKLICDDTSQMGSHMMTRICLTPEQAEARRKAAQQAAFEAQNKAKPLNANGAAPP